MRAEDVCDGMSGCRADESLLQSSHPLTATEVSSESKFCTDFFKGDDSTYAGKGVKQAKETFLKYCMKRGFSKTKCAAAASPVFGEGDDSEEQELTEKMCTDLVELAALADEMSPGTPAALLERQEGSHQDAEDVSSLGMR